MKIISDATEADMEAAFLKAEINSPRFRKRVLEQATRFNVECEIINNPDVTNIIDNKKRHDVLLGYRGSSSHADLFSTLPHNIEWKRVLITKEDLQKIRYLNEDAWADFSGGSRLVVNGALSAKNGEGIADMSPQDFKTISENIKAGQDTGIPILVGSSDDTNLVILEGHQRMTAYCMLGNDAPKDIPVIVGFSPQISQWVFF